MSWSSFWNNVKDVFTGNVPAQYNTGLQSSLGTNLLGFLGYKTDSAKDMDLARAEISADNQLERDRILQQENNAFNAQQAELAWQRTMDADNTKYQRAVEDMKTAGINPIMALGNIDTSVGMSSPSAGSSSARSGGSNYTGSSSGGRGAGFLAQVVAGLITKGKSKGSTLSQTFNNKGELVRSTITSK